MLGSTQDVGLDVNEMCVYVSAYTQLHKFSKNSSCQMGNMKQGQF